jgi:serine/threonine-protein kinase
MPLSSGTRLGGYEILSALGAGGMGEVYRARDTRLDRDVAIKMLPHAFFADAERVARFQREAKVLASLNHPNIGAIYGLHDEGDGVRALVMELVEGEDLSRRLTRGAIPLDEALPIATQIAQALEAAHGQGIIHRDLKPANIVLRLDETVKVLDFGLAKAMAGDAEKPELLDSPTVTAVATRAGTILGTAPYMSPEQAKGRPVDRRTDIWAFGAVLFELLTGTRAFQGESVTETLSHVLTQAPNWALLPSNTPPSIRTLLRRCLEKNPAKRLDSAAAVRLEIDDGLASPAGVTATSAPLAQRRRVSPAALAAVAAASLITALGTWALTRQASPPPALAARFTLTFPPTEPMDFSGLGRDIAVSPNGQYLAYQSGGRLMLRALDQLDGVPLSNVRGRNPFFSPDSRWIGFFDGGELKKVRVTGEPVITLSPELGNPLGGNGTWGDDGTIVVSSASIADPTIGLRRISAEGGDVTVLTRIDDIHRHATPSMLPGGRGVLFTIAPASPEDRRLAVLDLKSGEQKTVVSRGFAGQYLDTGHLLYAMAGSPGSSGQVFATLWVDGFDLDRLEVRGDPVRVGEALQVDTSPQLNFAVSSSGVLAYVPAREQLRSFVWVDRTGRETAIDGLPPGSYATLGLSPDDTRIAFELGNQEAEIHTYDFASQSQTRLTFDRKSAFLPRWTPDGQRIVFMSDRANRAGPTNLYSVAADGSGDIERLTNSKNMQWPNSITNDGTLLFAEPRPNTAYDIFRLPMAPPQGAGRASLSDERRSEPTALVSSPFDQYAANISPNGRYFAYQSRDADGRFVVYVSGYPDASRGPWQISTGGGSTPVWARSGRELFYLDESNTLMAVPVDTVGPQFTVSRPARVFDTKYWGNFYSYDVTRDGRFLMLKDVGQSQASVVVVLNWFEELKQRQRPIQ